ncbi:hypothetical protein OkiPb00243_24090 [Escherichia coli]
MRRGIRRVRLYLVSGRLIHIPLDAPIFACVIMVGCAARTSEIFAHYPHTKPERPDFLADIAVAVTIKRQRNAIAAVFMPVHAGAVNINNCPGVFPLWHTGNQRE